MEAVRARPNSENKGCSTALGVRLLFGTLLLLAILVVIFALSTNQVGEATVVAVPSDSVLPVDPPMEEDSVHHRAYVAIVAEAKRRDEDYVDGIDKTFLHELSNALAEIDQLQNPEELRSLALIADGEFENGLDQLMLVIDESEIGSSDRYERVGDIAFLIDSSRAIGAYRRVVKLDPENGRSLNRLSRLYLIEGNIVDAEDAVLKALAANSTDDLVGAESRYLIGLVHFVRGETEKAVEIYEHGLRIAMKIRDGSYMESFEHTLAAIYAPRDEMQKVRVMYEQVLPILKELGDKDAIARQYSFMGAVYSNLEDSSAAIDAYEEAIGLYTELNNLGEIASLRYLLCAVHSMRSDLIAARDACERAFLAGELSGDRELEAYGHFQFGNLSYDLKNNSAARAAWNTSIRLLADSDSGLKNAAQTRLDKLDAGEQEYFLPSEHNWWAPSPHAEPNPHATYK